MNCKIGMHSKTNMNSKTGALFVVATPIGNLADITLRAIDLLTQVDLILAEDTRRAATLLRHFKIRTPVKSFHQHNEAAQLPTLLRQLNGGAHIALISDAGTPLISDPGYRLVRGAREQGITVTPAPGASALIAALSASGQAAERFCFEGFLPAKVGPRAQRLQDLKNETRTVIFYEASHRIGATLAALVEAFGGERPVTVAREISKKFETFYCGTVAEVGATLAGDAHHRKGEFVLIVCGAQTRQQEPRQVAEAAEIMQLLMAEMPLKRASAIAARVLKQNRNELYQLGLKLKSEAGGGGG